MRVQFRKMWSDKTFDVEEEVDSVLTYGEGQAITWVGLSPDEPDTMIITLAPEGEVARGPDDPLTGKSTYFVRYSGAA